MSTIEKFEALERNTAAAVNSHVVEEGISDDVSKLSLAEMEARKKAIDSMDEELRNLYEKEKEAYKDHRGDIVTFNYDRGSVVAEINRNPKYGESAVNLMAVALGVDRSTVYKTIKFSNMYVNKNELNKVLEKAESRGMTLTWSHFANVLHIPESDSAVDPHEDRRKMIDAAIENKLSVRALAAEVKSIYGNKTAKKAYNSRANVKSLLKQVLSANQRFATKTKEKVDELINDFEEAVATGSSEDLKNFTESVHALNVSFEQLSSLMSRIIDFTSKFPGVIAKNSAERKKIVDSREEPADKAKKKKIAR
jgi:hypothetical protein